jgi:hypothetical protein
VKVAFCALAATLAVGAAAAEPAGSRAVAVSPLYGITYTNFGGDLTRFDPATLRPVGRRLRLPQDAVRWAFSPDGRQLALATERAGLQLVDLQRMRVRARLRGGRLVRGLAWPSARRVILAEHGGTVIVDPVGPRVRRRETLGGEVVGVAQAAAGLVLLARDGAGLGPSRLDVIDALGHARSVVPERIASGWDGGDNNQGPFRGQQPGLAVDRAGNRAFVVGGDGTIAEVNLATLAFAYREPRSLQARTKAAEGPRRSAAWIDGRLAIAGADDAARRHGDQLVTTSSPYGVRLFDPGTGVLRTLDARATEVAGGAGLVLTYGTLYDGVTGTISGCGLSAYRADGPLAWHLFDDAPVDTVFVRGTDAYVWARGELHAVELATGRARVTVRPPGMVRLLTEPG